MAANFIPYGKQWITEDDLAAVAQVLCSDFLTQGPAVEAFEKEICRVTNAKYCVSFCNATAALHAAVAALDVGQDAEGITSPNTFVASANCLVYNNLKPCFADIDSLTYNIDPVSLGEKINAKTRIVIPVHFAGQPADMNGIRMVLDGRGLRIIEDASHAIGSTYEDGSPVGCCSNSDITVFSFHPVKTITTGEGGAATTNNAELYEAMKTLRSHGIIRNPALMEKAPGPWYHEMQRLGFNFRLTDIQAALGVSQLSRLEEFKTRRREIVDQYNQAFGGLGGIILPYERKGLDSCFHLYVARFDFSGLKTTRKEMMSSLTAQGIGTQVHYIPVHTQPYYRNTWSYATGDFPHAEAYYEQALSLPLYPKMDDDDVLRVISAVKSELSR